MSNSNDEREFAIHPDREGSRQVLTSTEVWPGDVVRVTLKGNREVSVSDLTDFEAGSLIDVLAFKAEIGNGSAVVEVWRGGQKVFTREVEDLFGTVFF